MRGDAAPRTRADRDHVIDGETLAALMTKVACMRRNLIIEFKKLDEDFFSDEE
jgi:restriction endonuclease Mrr